MLWARKRILVLGDAMIFIHSLWHISEHPPPLNQMWFPGTAADGNKPVQQNSQNPLSELPPSWQTQPSQGRSGKVLDQERNGLWWTPLALGVPWAVLIVNLLTTPSSCWDYWNGKIGAREAQKWLSHLPAVPPTLFHLCGNNWKG